MVVVQLSVVVVMVVVVIVVCDQFSASDVSIDYLGD